MHIRWLIRMDLDRVLEIERTSSSSPWTEDEFLQTLRGRNNIGMVIEHEQEIVGFMIYRLNRGYIQLLNMAISPDHRHEGAGKAMIDKLIGKLPVQRRTRLVVTVPESDLGAHLFLKACGLKAVDIEKQYDDEDLYVFEYSVKTANPIFRNRISKYCDSFDN